MWIRRLLPLSLTFTSIPYFMLAILLIYTFGFGLRILSARSSFGNVLHVDLAFPLNRDPSIKSFQFLVQTKVSL